MELVALMAVGGTQDDYPILLLLANAERRVVAARASGSLPEVEDALVERFDLRRKLIGAVTAPSAPVMEKVSTTMSDRVDDGAEQLVVFDNAGNELLRHRGAADEVGFPDGDLPPGKEPADQWRGAIVAHTHRRGAVPPMQGLDPDDLLEYARLQPSCAVVAYEWQGQRYMQMLTAPSGWPDPSMARIEFETEFILAAKLEREGELGGEDPMHVALEQVAKRLGLGYSRRRTE
jgi:hypothetical protein